MKRPLHQFWLLTWVERSFLFEAFLMLLFARCLTLMMSAKRLVRFLKTTADSTQNLTEKQVRTVGQVREAIHRISPYVPVRSVCLQRALAGRLMLQRRCIPSQFTFGGHVDNGKLKGHAWLKSGEHWVTGRETASKNKEILTL